MFTDKVETTPKNLDAPKFEPDESDEDDTVVDPNISTKALDPDSSDSVSTVELNVSKTPPAWIQTRSITCATAAKLSSVDTSELNENVKNNSNVPRNKSEPSAIADIVPTETEDVVPDKRKK